MSIQFSVSPSPFTTGVARRAFFAPSSDASQTSPLSTYATDAASAIAGETVTGRPARSLTRRAAGGHLSAAGLPRLPRADPGRRPG